MNDYPSILLAQAGAEAGKAIGVAQEVSPLWVHGVLFVVLAGLVGLVAWGGVLWRRMVLGQELLNAQEKIQNKDAVVVLAKSLVLVLVAAYVALAAGAACFPGKWMPLGVVGVWVAAGLAVGWLLGLLFGHPEIEEKEDAAAVRRRRVKQNSSLAQVTDWLTKAIVGVGLVEAQNIIRWGEGAAKRLGDALAAGGGEPASSLGFALMAAVLIIFPVIGFLAGYLVTRTFIVLALCRAEVAASDAANQGTQSEQALFQINDSEFESLDTAPLQLGEKHDEMGARVVEAVEKIVAHPLESLVSWKHIRLWAKAQLMRALMAEGEEAKNYAAEAERAFLRAVDLVPHDAETRLGFAVALQLRDAAKREILSQLEAARDSLMAKSSVDLRKNVFKSLMFRYLYLPEPESFLKALAAAKDYFQHKDAIPSGGIWVNMACAYGLAVKWLSDTTRTLMADKLVVAQKDVPPDTAPREVLLRWLRESAVHAAREAIERSAKWKPHLRKFAGMDGGDPENADLTSVAEDLKPILE